MSVTINFPYTTPGNYTYDSDKIEVTGGVAKLKDMRGDAVVGCTYTTDEDANFYNSGDTPTGSLQNGATVSGGDLVLTGGNQRYCEYDADLISTISTKGCLRIKIRPNTTNPTVPCYLWNAATKLYIYFDGTNIRYVLKNDSSGVIVQKIINKSFLNLQVGQITELEFNWDQTPASEVQRTFYNGTLYTTDNVAGTRNNPFSNTTFEVGHYSGATTCEFDIAEWVLFDEMQHTATYSSPSANIPETKYSVANDKIEINTTFKANNLLTFSETSTKTGSDEIKYTIEVNGQDKYYSGGVTNSNGTYAEANTETEISTNIEDFISTRSTIGLNAFLHSDDGSTTPELDLNSFTYDSVLPTPSLPVNIDLEGFIYDANGAYANKSIYIRPYEHGFKNEGVFHLYENQKATIQTNSDGWFESKMYVQPSGEKWEIKIGVQSYYFELPGGLSENEVVDLTDLTLTPIIEED